MKFGQLIKAREMFFFKYHAKNETEREVPDISLFLQLKGEETLKSCCVCRAPC